MRPARRRQIDPLEARRQAAALFAAGYTRAAVARAVGVSRATAGAWYRRWRAAGVRGLTAVKRHGRPPLLACEDLLELQRALARPPRESGFDLERWSLAAVAALIERTRGVRYHPRHVARVLRRLGWVVPPVGPHARYAFRERVLVDGDGNPIALRERGGR